MAGHRSAISRLLGSRRVWLAGPSIAGPIGAGLVVVDAIPEVYLSAESWEGLARSLHLSVSPGRPDVLVRIPRKVWPFGPAGPGQAALAASLLDGEWRATRAGAEVLNDLAGRSMRAGR